MTLELEFLNAVRKALKFERNGDGFTAYRTTAEGKREDVAMITKVGVDDRGNAIYEVGRYFYVPDDYLETTAIMWFTAPKNVSGKTEIFILGGKDV